MSSRISRRLVASALLAGSLGLFPGVAGATPTRSSGPRQAAVASQSLFDSLWSLLTHLWAADDAPNHHPGQPGDPPHPHTDEGPGICPHGH